MSKVMTEGNTDITSPFPPSSICSINLATFEYIQMHSTHETY